MGSLWILVVFVSLEQICAIQLEDAKIKNVQKIEPPKDDYQIKDLKVLNADIVDTNINFKIGWKSNLNVYTSFLETTISKTLNPTMDRKNHKKNFTIHNNNHTNEFEYLLKSNYNFIFQFSFQYFPATTYQIQISSCSNQSICEGNTTNRYKFPKTTFYHTLPTKPIINFINITSCNNNTCNMDVNIANLQISNSSLYGYQQKNGRNITKELVKSLIKMKIENSIEFDNTTNNYEGIKIPLKYICNNYSYLILVNDYLEEVNYDTHHLSSNQTYCSSENYKKTNRNLEENANNYYYLLIIPAVIIIIGIIIFIKRKSLHKFYKQITDNQHEMAMEPSTIIPLVRKNSMKLLQKFNNRSPSHLLTPEGLQIYFQGNSEKIINNLNTEFKNVGEDTSQNIYGESFEDKNRYKNILPYEETRVKLNLVQNKFNSHYINASYIKGYNNDRKYIATQGPTVKTLGDFWRMIWQEKITLIIMLTNTKENDRKKCEQYWPDKGVKSYEDYTVTSQSVHKYFEYTKREFSLTHMNLERNVTQLHFTIWPDKGIPQTPYSLVKFLKAARDYKNIGPILVHCSAGIGRTGTFILCDYIIDMLNESGKADFPQALNTLRKCRKNLVQYIAQYLYSHCVINEYLHTILLDVNENEFKENNVNEATIAETLRNIENSDYWLNVLHPATFHHGYNQNQDKHRINAPQPLNSTGFISVQRYPNQNKESYYTDAVEILSEQGILINTTQPLPNTLSAFWRLILEKNITLILSLQELDADDETSIQFWPTPEEKLNPTDFITLTLIELATHEAYDSIRIHLEDSKNNVTKYVSIIHFKNWKRNSLPDINDFLLYHKVFEEFPRKEPILVACHDASDASSVFITFLYLLDLLKWNLTIDVNTAISTLKIYRKSFNLDMVKLKFIYDVMQIFLQDLNEDFYKDTEAAYENLKLE